MATTAILWHRACSILKIGQSKRAAGWPDALNIEQLSTLHYPSDASMAEALLSLMAADIEAGSLPACGFEHVPGDEDYRQLIARFGATSQGPAIRSRDIPMVSRDAYRDWPARPDLPEDSPLHGWIAATPAPEAQREATNGKQPPARQILPRKPTKRNHAWTEVILATIDAFEAEHGFSPTAREAWARLANTRPDGWNYVYRQDRNDCLMAGEKLPLDQATFEQRFRRLFQAKRSR
ncbi:hypothetical protein [Thiorhodovibrio frisius]|uniref:Uncharacterized protein n=1 Tax=Thiorhodovibrio frisius TaxID=631362 RepID=H8Z5F3_9GAMM|nr:hypothetical protein [Thiorhodovibrio frisius]EIC19499.1 hypothetical protein Thi970DRAFT_03077 [Thiorhodovibrio frisius]WPL20538.1 hypothetical protein Thiofri_00637 [Thiorhodovibrio frisius]